MAKEMLKKMKMPAKREDEMLDMEDLDLAGLEHKPADLSEMDMGDESEEAKPLEGKESAEEEQAELAHIPDEDLQKELEARGFVVSQPEKGEESEEEESSESLDEEQAELEKEALQ